MATLVATHLGPQSRHSTSRRAPPPFPAHSPSSGPPCSPDSPAPPPGTACNRRRSTTGMTNCGGKLPRAGRRAREGDMAEPWLRSSRHQTGSVVSSRKGIGLVGGKATWMDGWMDRKEGSAEGGGRSDGQKWMQMSCVRGCIDYLQAARSFRRGIETPFAAPTARHRSPTLFCFGSDQKNQNPTKVVSP